MTVTTEVRYPGSDTTPGPKSEGKGIWQLLDTMTEELPSPTPGITRHTFHMGGIAHLAARTAAVKEMLRWSEIERTTSAVSSLAARGKAGTALYITRTQVTAVEGRFTEYGGGLVQLNKGSSQKGHRLDPATRWPVWVVEGYGGVEACRAVFAQAMSKVPDTEQVSFEGLNDSSSFVQDVYLWTHPGFGEGAVPGSLFLATGYDRQADIVDGYGWYPEGQLFSEHGSVEGEMLRRNGGLLSDYDSCSLSFAHCWDLPTGREECYRAVMGLSYQTEA